MKIAPTDVDLMRIQGSPHAFGDPRGGADYEVLRAASWGTDYDGQRNAIANAIVQQQPQQQQSAVPQQIQDMINQNAGVGQATGPIPGTTGAPLAVPGPAATPQLLGAGPNGQFQLPGGYMWPGNHLWGTPGYPWPVFGGAYNDSPGGVGGSAAGIGASGSDTG